MKRLTFDILNVSQMQHTLDHSYIETAQLAKLNLAVMLQRLHWSILVM